MTSSSHLHKVYDEIDRVQPSSEFKKFPDSPGVHESLRAAT